MSDIKLFRFGTGGTVEIPGQAVTIEKSLQSLIERDCETFLGVTFLESEYVTGKMHGGRIDTLGIDESECPVIIEYKRATNENVINQGLFYLDWLLDHKAEFKLLVMDKISKARADAIDWSWPRLICIAGDFSRYDQHAVQQINRSIDLFRYRQFGNDLVALQLVHRTSSAGDPQKGGGPKIQDTAQSAKPTGAKTGEQGLVDVETSIKDVLSALQAFLKSLGDDVVEKQMKLYVVYRRIKNFACVVIQKKGIVVYLKIDAETVQMKEGFTRDVTNIGHWGTGNLEVTLRSISDLKLAEPLIARSYDAS